MKLKLSHAPASIIIEMSGIKRDTFNQRVRVREVEYTRPYGTDRWFLVKSWNKKNPDYPVSLD